MTLPVSGGSLDPVTGLGTVEHSGGIKFKAGKKTAAVNTLLLDTTNGSLNAKVAGKSDEVRLGQGLHRRPQRLRRQRQHQLAEADRQGRQAAEQEARLHRPEKRQRQSAKATSGPRRARSSSRPFKGNRSSAARPAKRSRRRSAWSPTGNAQLVLSDAALEKLKNVGPEPVAPAPHPFEVKLAPVEPTKVVSLSPVTTVFPISGGTIGPAATAGILQTAGGLQTDPEPRSGW